MKPLFLTRTSPFRGTLKAIEALVRASRSKLSRLGSHSASRSAAANRNSGDADSEITVPLFPSILQTGSASSLAATGASDGAPIALFQYEDDIPDGANPGDVDELERSYHTFTFKPLEVKKPFTENFDLMDDMFDAVLLMKPPIDTIDREELKEKIEQDANDAKAQIFPLAPPRRPERPESSQSGISPEVKNKTRVEIFPAYLKALQFFYLRFLLRAGIYDLPMFSLTVEDVDRLGACGMIQREHMNHVFLLSMLGHGCFRRYLRDRGLAQIDHTTAPRSGLWTVPEDTRPPTREEIFKFIADCENFRFRRPYARPGFRLASFERPKYTREYFEHRIQRDGAIGLKRMANLPDGTLRLLLDPKDPAFIPPGPRLDALRGKVRLDDTSALKDIPTVLGLKNAVWEGENDLDDEDMKFYSSVATSISGLERADSRGENNSCSSNEEVRSTVPSFQSLRWPICVPTYESKEGGTTLGPVKPTFFPPECPTEGQPLPAFEVSACKSRKDRPPAQPAGNSNILYDPYFNKNFHRPQEGRELQASDYIIYVQEDTERSPKYALLYDLIIPSWAELCARWKLPPPYKQLGHGTNPTIDPEKAVPGSSSVVPFHRRPHRRNMVFLHEVFPQFHPDPNAPSPDESFESQATEIVESSNEEQVFGHIRGDEQNA